MKINLIYSMTILILLRIIKHKKAINLAKFKF